MKHEWIVSTEHPDVCKWCDSIRAPRPEIDLEECAGRRTKIFVIWTRTLDDREVLWLDNIECHTWAADPGSAHKFDSQAAAQTICDRVNEAKRNWREPAKVVEVLKLGTKTKTVGFNEEPSNV